MEKNVAKEIDINKFLSQLYYLLNIFYLNKKTQDIIYLNYLI